MRRLCSLAASLALALLVSKANPTRAQSAAPDLAQLNDRLLHKDLYLRGQWAGDHLRFDSTGKLLGTSPRWPFTLCGIDVTKVHLSNDKLVIEGKRVGLEFIGEVPKRVPLNKLQSGSSLKIEIAQAPDYSPALNAIFADSLQQLGPDLPSYWQKYARAHLYTRDGASASHDQAAAANSPSATIFKVGGSVSPPKLLRSSEPDYNPSARALRYSGACLVSLVLDPEGHPTQVQVARPIGLGLDEQALAAVQQYAFSPAQKDGKPVAVSLNVEVSFQIF